jgi:STE24 endopeptidase
MLSNASPPPPAAETSDDAGMTAAQLAEAKRYGRLELGSALADKALDVAFLAVAAMLLARPLDAWLQAWTLLETSRSLRLVALFLLVTGLHVAVSFPLSYYSGHALEHRFALSTQTFGKWFWRYGKRVGLSALLGAALLLGLYWIIWLCGPWWWVAAAAAFFLVSVVLGQLAPVLILPLFYKVEKLDAPELAGRMARLADGTGLSIEGVYRLDLSAETVKANAALAGLGRTRRVLLGDTLLKGFSPEEIEVIFAHEIGHHVFRHIRKMIAAGVALSAAGFWLCDRLLTLWVGRFEPQVEYAAMPVYTLPLLMLILAVFGMAVEPLQNTISRHYERQCDRYALERTGQKAAYVSAFQKLARLNKDDPAPHWLEVVLFHSHPPIAERLAMAEQPVGNG